MPGVMIPSLGGLSSRPHQYQNNLSEQISKCVARITSLLDEIIRADEARQSNSIVEVIEQIDVVIEKNKNLQPVEQSDFLVVNPTRLIPENLRTLSNRQYQMTGMNNIGEEIPAEIRELKFPGCSGKFLNTHLLMGMILSDPCKLVENSHILHQLSECYFNEEILAKFSKSSRWIRLKQNGSFLNYSIPVYRYKKSRRLTVDLRMENHSSMGKLVIVTQLDSPHNQLKVFEIFDEKESPRRTKNQASMPDTVRTQFLFLFRIFVISLVVVKVRKRKKKETRETNINLHLKNFEATMNIEIHVTVHIHDSIAGYILTKCHQILFVLKCGDAHVSMARIKILTCQPLMHHTSVGENNLAEWVNTGPLVLIWSCLKRYIEFGSQTGQLHNRADFIRYLVWITLQKGVPDISTTLCFKHPGNPYRFGCMEGSFIPKLHDLSIVNIGVPLLLEVNLHDDSFRGARYSALKAICNPTTKQNVHPSIHAVKDIICYTVLALNNRQNLVMVTTSIMILHIIIPSAYGRSTDATETLLCHQHNFLTKVFLGADKSAPRMITITQFSFLYVWNALHVFLNLYLEDKVHSRNGNMVWYHDETENGSQEMSTGHENITLFSSTSMLEFQLGNFLPNHSSMTFPTSEERCCKGEGTIHVTYSIYFSVSYSYLPYVEYKREPENLQHHYLLIIISEEKGHYEVNTLINCPRLRQYILWEDGPCFMNILPLTSASYIIFRFCTLWEFWGDMPRKLENKSMETAILLTYVQLLWIECILLYWNGFDAPRQPLLVWVEISPWLQHHNVRQGYLTPLVVKIFQGMAFYFRLELLLTLLTLRTRSILWGRQCNDPEVSGLYLVGRRVIAMK